jgi:hypothetical protein
VILGTHKYSIPANYFDPKGGDKPDTFQTDDYFGFSLFLPDYGGFTTANWQNPNDPQRIEVLHVMLGDIGKLHPLESCVTSDLYGDARSQFRECRRFLEEKPSLHAYGLHGYRSKTDPKRVTWTGERAGKNFFFFQSIQPPGSKLDPERMYYLSHVKYYSEPEGLFIEYIIRPENADKWYEIDVAIWSKLHGWQVK